jgi:hypothetical protein
LYGVVCLVTGIYVRIGISRINPKGDVKSSYENEKLWRNPKKLKNADKIFETMVKTRDETYRQLKGH